MTQRLTTVINKAKFGWPGFRSRLNHKQTCNKHTYTHELTHAQREGRNEDEFTFFNAETVAKTSLSVSPPETLQLKDKELQRFLLMRHVFLALTSVSSCSNVCRNH